MEPIYRVEGAGVQTSTFAGGPWDRTMQHGAAPSSLVVWAAESIATRVPMRIARVTVRVQERHPTTTHTQQ